MKLGAFSISLVVKDIHQSKAFYQSLGFEAYGGHIEQHWLIMKSGDTLIGLFEGMFEKNRLTFNPGWNQRAENLDDFDDVRDIHARLKAAGVALSSETITDAEGPASFIAVDPDGNHILIDQHR